MTHARVIWQWQKARLIEMRPRRRGGCLRWRGVLAESVFSPQQPRQMSRLLPPWCAGPPLTLARASLAAMHASECER
jgi:hypothetical protein